MKKIRTIEAPASELKKLKVCAYVRVSTDQVEQQESFAAQVEHYTNYIKNNPAWNFAGIYADNALSSKNAANRPEFMRMIKDAEAKKFDLILTKSISRFARNKIDTLETVRKLKSIDIAIHFEKEAINTLTAESELMLSILSSVAEEDLVSISQNMRWSIQHRFKQGKIMINTQRFLGYDKDKNGNLIINKAQAAIIRRIFKDYLSGLGVSLIAKNLHGIPTLTGKDKWSESTIRDVLKNEKYAGDALLQKTVTTNFKKKRNKGDAPMYYVKESHPAIISREDFEKVQGLIAERARSKGNTEGNRDKYANRYPFTGTIICGHCGNTYKRHLDNCGTLAESVCWICRSYIIGRKISCDVGRIKEETIKGLFVRMFNRLYSDRFNILGEYKQRLESERFDNGRIAELDEEIESLLQQERQLLFIEGKGYGNLNITKAEHEKLVSTLTKFQTERATLVSELTKHDSRMARTMELEAMMDGPISEFNEDLYSKIVEKIIVKERTRLVFQLKNGLVFEEKYTLGRGQDIL